MDPHLRAKHVQWPPLLYSLVLPPRVFSSCCCSSVTCRCRLNTIVFSSCWSRLTLSEQAAWLSCLGTWKLYTQVSSSWPIFGLQRINPGIPSRENTPKKTKRMVNILLSRVIDQVTPWYYMCSFCTGASYEVHYYLITDSWTLQVMEIVCISDQALVLNTLPFVYRWHLIIR